MGAISDLWKSERGLFALALATGATVLAIMGIMTVEQWTGYTQWIFGIYVGGKSITTAVGMVAAAKKPAAGNMGNVEKPEDGS